MPDSILIYKKLAEVLKQLGYLKKLSRLSEKELVFEETRLFLAERVMERLIGAAIDINMHLISDLSDQVSDDYFSSFIDLARIKVLPLPLAEKLAPAAGLRNILVHEYMELNIKKFRSSMESALKYFPKYIKYIQKIID